MAGTWVAIKKKKGTREGYVFKINLAKLSDS